MTPDQAKTVMNFLIPTVEAEHKTTRKILAAIPDGKGDYTPDAKSMTAIDLAWHIAGAEMMFMSGVLSGEFPTGDGKRPENVTTAADVVAFYDQCAANNAKLKDMTGEQCLQELNFHGVFKMPAASFVQIMLNHGIHHRGQLSAYLRPMGAKVPAIYGGSADEPMQMPATAK
jgi:uncharacterized damage-inducible protein DinB